MKRMSKSHRQNCVHSLLIYIARARTLVGAPQQKYDWYTIICLSEVFPLPKFYLSIYLYVYLSIYMSTCLSIHLSIYLSTSQPQMCSWYALLGGFGGLEKGQEFWWPWKRPGVLVALKKARCFCFAAFSLQILSTLQGTLPDELK